MSKGNGNGSMKIVFVDNALLNFGGGYESFVLDQAGLAVGLGHEAIILTPTPSVSECLSLVLAFRRLSRGLSDDEVASRLGKSRLERLGALRARSVLREADVVYSKNEPHELLFSALAKPRHVPLVVGFHSATENLSSGVRNAIYRGSAYRSLLRLADGVHILHASQAEFAVHGLGVPRSRVHLIGSGIRMTGPPSVQARTKGSRFKLLFVGRLEYQKGFDLFCDLVRVLNLGPLAARLEVTIAGDGALEYLAKRLVDQWNNVEYVGRSSSVNALYRAHDVVVLPSRWETFGLVALEALSSGTPVLLSTIPPFLAHDTSGAVHCPEWHARTWARQVEALEREWREQPEKWAARRNNALLYVAEHFDADRRARDFVEMLAGVVRASRLKSARSSWGRGS